MITVTALEDTQEKSGPGAIHGAEKGSRNRE